MTIIIPYYQGVQPELLSHSSFWAWWVAEMCLAREFLDNLISYCWRKCVSSCCWSWHCWLSPEASCAPHSATSPSRTLWQPLSSPVHLLYSSTTQKGKTTYIFLAVKLAQEISALNTFSLHSPTQGQFDNIAKAIWWDAPVSPVLAARCGRFSCAFSESHMIISFCHEPV